MFKNFGWGHGIATAMASFIIFILSMIFFFPMGQKNSELITEDYYEEELAYQDVIDAKNRADQLPSKPQYSSNSTGIRVVFPKTINNSNSKFEIDLHRSEDKNLDVNKPLTLDEQNALFIPKQVLAKGNYVLRVKWTTGEKKYQVDYDLVW